MAKSIKYRAWLKRTKTIHEVAVIDTTNGNVVFKEDYRQMVYKTPPVVCHVWEHSKSVILMQSTGFRDKKGVMIFEGDIFYVEAPATPMKMLKGEVRRSIEGSWIFGGDGDREEDGYLLIWRRDSGKVIGNIYENPELLK